MVRYESDNIVVTYHVHQVYVHNPHVMLKILYNNPFPPKGLLSFNFPFL